ncbi:MAG: ethylbenzene dehydrogenase-related protein, partial [Candidatus Zixiibacteriota bacterium]
RGCMNKCHRDVDNTNAGNDSTTLADDAFLPAGQTADMWHMKAARSLGVLSANQFGDLTVDANTHEVTTGKVTMVGYLDDKFVGEFTDSGDGGRHGDAGGSTYARNRNAAKDGPLYIETDPTDYIDAMILTQAEIDNGEAVLVTDVSDLASVWAKYAALSAVVPERILRPPAGSRGDVMQAGTWDNGVWYVEMKRALNTGNDDDAQFTVGSFKFGLALIDNGGGAEHWTTGSVLHTLNIKSITGVEDRKVAEFPKSYSLSQNYPNPFNPTTNIEFELVQQGNVKLKIYNILGEEVATVVDKVMPAGRQKITFDGANLATGVYFYRLEVNGFVATKKLLLMK